MVTGMLIMLAVDGALFVAMVALLIRIEGRLKRLERRRQTGRRRNSRTAAKQE